MKLKIALGVIFLSCLARAVEVNPEENYGSLSDFSAPVVSATSAVSDKQVGMIIFDVGTNQFKGLNKDGTWDAMTVAGSNTVTSSGSSERVERVSVTSTCSSGTCTIASQSGSWVSTIAWNSTGNYTVNFVASIFSAAPTCVITPQASQVGIQSFPSTSSVNFETRNGSGTLTNTSFSIICMGPR